MDWLLLDDKINKVMRNVAQLNGDGLSDLSLMETKFQQNTNAFGEAVTAFNYKLLNTLSEANGSEVKNVFISPGRLQAILVLMSNWVGWYMREQILEAICCKEMDLMEVNEMFADERYIIPYASKEDLEEGYVPTIDLKTMMWYQYALKTTIKSKNDQILKNLKIDNHLHLRA